MSKSGTFGVEVVSKGDEEVLYKNFEAKHKKTSSETFDNMSWK